MGMGVFVDNDFPMFIPQVIERIWEIIYKKLYAPTRSRCLGWLWGVQMGNGVGFWGDTRIRTRHKGSISIGNGVRFNAVSNWNLVGLVNPTILDTRPGGAIEIGAGSGFSSVVMSSRSKITIGAHVNCGGNVRIFDHNFHVLDPIQRRTRENPKEVRTAPIVIEDDCFIGTNAMILKGTHLGRGTIVAAGSVVFGLTTPPMSMVKGNPAVVIGGRDDR